MTVRSGLNFFSARAAPRQNRALVRLAMPPKFTGSKRKADDADAGSSHQPARKKDSHLYTDDNPDTTLHGTGFQDAAAAQKTIHLVSQRSLTYQFQVINTMFYRAKHHPHPNARMHSAMDIFQQWLDQYQTQKQQVTKFKTVQRPLVAATLKALDDGHLKPEDASIQSSDAFETGLRWARIYVDMPSGKRLANTLTTTDPEQPDMDSLRTSYLQQLVPDNSKQQAWRADTSGTSYPSDVHIQWLLFGYSPYEGKVKKFLAKYHSG